jgi:flagellar biogenesis protein FliO
VTSWSCKRQMHAGANGDCNDMTAGFWAAYLVKLSIVGVLLTGLYVLARRLRAVVVRGGHRYVDVVESTMLSPHAAVHLLRVGSSYLLVGGGTAGLAKLAEFPASRLRPPEPKPRNT